MWLIAGLGNPGKKYMYTWHNMGYLAVDLLAERNGFFLDKDKFSGMYGKGKIKGEDAIIIKPTTFMNNSGECIVPAAKFFKGTIRVREKCSAGTHNGMRSCIQHLGTELFPRVRIGTGPVPEHYELINYVLTDVPKDERVMMNDAFVKACEAIEKMVEDGKKS